MSIVVSQTVLTGLAVKDAMRRQVVQLPQDASIGQSINHLIKFKVNGFLTVDAENLPVGVVSKTDIMGAYYAGLPIASPLSDIMASPPQFCQTGDTLDHALNQMRAHGVYRLYVRDGTENVVGALAYPDIVGLLYRYCYSCDHSRNSRKHDHGAVDSVLRISISDVMTTTVTAFTEEDSLLTLMEGLSMYHFGAVLIRSNTYRPTGVVSKTDLMLAYKHDVPADARAEQIMSTPVRSVPAEGFLEDAIRQMIFSEVHRLFIHREHPDNIVGVLSLSDTARVRSGSCQACVSARIRLEADDD